MFFQTFNYDFQFFFPTIPRKTNQYYTGIIAAQAENMFSKIFILCQKDRFFYNTHLQYDFVGGAAFTF